MWFAGRENELYVSCSSERCGACRRGRTKGPARHMVAEQGVNAMRSAWRQRSAAEGRRSADPTQVHPGVCCHPRGAAVEVCPSHGQAVCKNTKWQDSPKTSWHEV